MCDALDAAITTQGDSWLGPPSLRAVQRAELLRTLHGFIEWEMQLHEDMTDPRTKKRNAPKMVRTGVWQSELKFDDMLFERDGVRIRYRGSIDRVEVGVDSRIGSVKMIAAADYKSSISSAPGGGDKKAWLEGVVIQIPLYAYALSKLHPEHEIARVEYLTLGKPGSALPLQLYTVDRKTGQLNSDADAADQWNESLDRAIAHVKQARQGEFPAQPPASCGCPPWCHGIDICRIPRKQAVEE